MSDIAIPQEIWDHELTASAPTTTDWLWQGFIARANMTLFTSHGKLGKTTLLSMLLSRRKQGGTLAGLTVKPGRTGVISDEPRAVWEDRARHFDFGGNDFAANWDHLRGVLEEAPQKLTRRDILDEWPTDFEKPGITALRSWLDRALALGAIACEGTGRKKDPFRYWLPEREAVWKQDPLYDLFEEQRQKLKLPFESLRTRKRKLGDPESGSFDVGLPSSEFADDGDRD